MKPYAKQNHANGYDLLTKKDPSGAIVLTGDEVRITTGGEEESIDYWRNLRDLCDGVLDEMIFKKGKDREFLVKPD